MTITKDTKIGEIVQNHPEVVETLMSFGVQCVGCGAADFETLEQGFKSHGMDDADVQKAVIELNKAKEKVSLKEGKIEKGKASFDVTESAAKKIKELRENEEDALRLAIIPGGCSGFQYHLGFDKKQRDNDHIFEKDGVKVFIDPESMDVLNEGSIKYVETLQESGFKIDHPDQHDSCGCGKSFS